jgi:hypothetical protein
MKANPWYNVGKAVAGQSETKPIEAPSSGTDVLATWLYPLVSGNCYQPVIGTPVPEGCAFCV